MTSVQVIPAQTARVEVAAEGIKLMGRIAVTGLQDPDLSRGRFSLNPKFALPFLRPKETSKMKHVPLEVEPNGAFVAFEVFQGDYNLSVIITKEDDRLGFGVPIASGQKVVTIPADPPDGTFDLGEVEVALQQLPKAQAAGGK